MRSKPVLLLLLAVLGLAWGLLRLLQLRFERGDVYAEFSTLRSDPAGSRALYESLQSVSGIEVERSFRPVSRLEAGPSTAILFLGASTEGLGFAEAAAVARLELLVRSGARLVVALAPAAPAQRPSPAPRDARTPTPGARRPVRARPTPVPGWEEEAFVSLPKRWSFDTAWKRLGQTPMMVRLQKTGLALPATVPWRGAAWFRNLAPAWRIVYVREDSHPVVIERTLGKGTVVLCSDASFATNLALLREREPALLAWLIGDKRRVLFEETHLGVSESRGVAALARKYGLHGLAAGVLALALLFAWQSAISFPRPAGATTPPASDAVAGRRAFEALAAVLARNIPPGRLLATCVEQWKKTLPRQGAGREAQVAAIDAIVRQESETPLRRRDILTAYRRVSAIVAARKGRT